MKKSLTHPSQKFNCENCGKPDELEFFEYVLNGITLCQDCADLPVNKVVKRNPMVNWVKIDGEFFPPNYPIAQKAEENSG